MPVLPSASGADLIRVLLLLGFVPVEHDGRQMRLRKHFSAVIVPHDDAPLAPADVRTILRHADVSPATFVEFLTELGATG